MFATPFQFEHYLGYLFKSQGYAVKVTHAAGDYGADFEILLVA
jgi:restriction system protein